MLQKNIEGLHFFFFSEASPKSKETKIQIKHKNSGNK